MLNSLVSLLPASWQDKAKGIVGAVGAVVFVVVTSLDSVPHWVDVVVAVLTALGVYVAPNLGYKAPAVEPKGEGGESAVNLLLVALVVVVLVLLILRLV